LRLVGGATGLRLLIEFIDENGVGPGLRLRKRQHKNARGQNPRSHLLHHAPNDMLLTVIGVAIGLAAIAVLIIDDAGEDGHPLSFVAQGTYLAEACFNVELRVGNQQCYRRSSK
jgi:hypothetical protein